MRVEFKIPDLGENIDSGDVVKVLVSVGDQIKPEQPLMELETGKAVVEVPADTTGRIAQVFVNEGDHITVGQAVFVIETDLQADLSAPPPPPAKAQAPVPQPAAPAPVAPPPPSPPTQPAAAAPPSPVQSSAAAPPKPTQPAAVPPPKPTQPVAQAAPPVHRETAAIPAAPNVRRLARELGVDLTTLKITGADDHISEEDVRIAARKLYAPPPTAFPVFTSALANAQSMPGAPVSLPDFARYGKIERKPMSNVRLATAQHLSMAWTMIPQVTQYDGADITVLNELRQRYGPAVQTAGGKLTVTAVLVKVIASALRQFPHFNASVDMGAREIIEKDYVHVGVAVATERGLLVPVIRDADRKNITELSVELARTTQKAHNRELKPADLEGGTFSITNLGSIGGTHFTPIVNWPEVAILGISRAQREPVWKDDKFVPRLMLPLSLSYDHRVIDGADGARFLRWICEALEQPFFLALEG